MRLFIYEDRPAEFWVRMGPFFSSREVRREMPYLHDAPGYVWFVLLERGFVTGFASCHLDARRVGHLHGLYVCAALRGNGVAARLVEERLEWLRAHGAVLARAVVNEKSLPILEAAGFEAKGARGSYRTVELRLEEKVAA